MSRELMMVLSLFGIYAGCILLPLIPAVLIYRLFPSTTVAVSGPLPNLTVRASGAFAAYLVVFAMTYPLVQTTKETIGGFQRQFWTINGQVKLIDAEGKEIRSQSLLNKIAVTTKPEPHTVQSYHVRLKVVEGGEGDFPLVIVQIPQFGEKVIDLKSIRAGIKIDHYYKTIDLREPIIIQEVSHTGAIRTLSSDPEVDEGPRAASVRAAPR